MGRDISAVMIKVVDAAVAKAYGGQRKIQWMEVFAGEGHPIYGPDVWLPGRSPAGRARLRGVHQRPLTTPVGGGIRSLNVALRQELDLYVCLRPVRYFRACHRPERARKTNMVIFRENSEDIYAGIEFPAEIRQGQEAHQVFQNETGRHQDPLPNTSGIGVKPVSRRHRAPDP